MPETTDVAVAAAEGKKKKAKPRKIPNKRSINLAVQTENKINWAVAAPSILLIVAAAVAFSKYGVIDRYEAAAQARREADTVRQRLNSVYAEIEAMGDLNDRYAHYTTSGMTYDELHRPDRLEVMDLLYRRVVGRMPNNSWTISGNRMALTIKGQTLQDINLVVQELMTEELVNYCTVTTISGSVERESQGAEQYPPEAWDPSSQETQGGGENSENPEGGELPTPTPLLPQYEAPGTHKDDKVTASIVIILNNRP